MRTFRWRSEPGGFRNPQTKAQLFGIEPGPHNGVRAWRRWQCTVCEGFVDSTDVIPVAAPPCCSIEITCNHVNLLTNHDSTDGEDELLGNASLFGVDVAYVLRQHRKSLLVAEWQGDKMMHERVFLA